MRSRWLQFGLALIGAGLLPISLSAADSRDGKPRNAYWIQSESVRRSNLVDRQIAASGGSILAESAGALLVEWPADVRPQSLMPDWQVTELSGYGEIGHWQGTFDPLVENPFASRAAGESPTSAGDGVGLFLIQLVGPPDDAWLQTIRQHGVEFVTYFPYYSYLARIEPQEMSAVRSESFVRWVGPWTPAMKFDPETNELRHQNVSAVEINLVVFNPSGSLDATLPEKAAVLAERGTLVTSGLVGNHEIIQAVVDSPSFDALAALSNVIAVEAYHPPHLDDESSNLIDGGQYTGEVGNSPPSPTWASYLTTIGVNGSRTTIGVVDDGIDTAESHVTGRVTNILSGATSGATGHGHHVAGIAAGSCSHAADSDGYRMGAGVAPGASLLNQPYLKAGWANGCGTATAYGCLTKQAVTTAGSGAGSGNGYVQNNSWGSGSAINPQTYGSIEREYDLRVRDANESTAAPSNEALIVCFSAGNSGTAGMTKPKSAKNIITTGATDNYRPGFNSGQQPGGGNGCPSAPGNPFPDDNINMMVCFSSMGYVNDNRVKPDVVSPGANIASARGGADALWGNIDTNHRWCSGTSQASPHTTGIAALLVDKWRKDNGNAYPSPAVVKAMIINSAVEIRTTTSPSSGSVYNVTTNLPNVSEGWGRVNANRFLNPGAIPIQFRDQLAGDVLGTAPTTLTFNYAVGSSSAPTYVTLVWTDMAAAVNANPQLVNDLDLEVDWNGNTYLGNVLAGKSSVTGGTRDSRNNVENVFLPTVTAGQSITVRVKATVLAGDGVPGNADTTDQDFALVVYNASPGSGCSNPSAVDVTPNGTSMVCTGVGITYTASATGGTAPLSYQWTEDGVNVGGATSSTYTPNKGTAQSHTYNCKVTGSGCSGSTQDATASTGTWTAVPAAPAVPTFTNVSCDTLTVNWTAVAGATQYDVYRRNTSCGTGTLVGSNVVGTSFGDSGLAASSTYAYYVVAENSCGVSANGTCTTVTTTGTPAAPAAPTLTPGCTNIALSWAAVSGATDYEVWRSAGGNCAGATQLAASTSGATTYDNTGLANGAQFSYFVKAKNSCGTSANGTCATATTLTTPTAPTGVVAAGSCSGVTMSWNAVAGATSYTVLRSAVDCPSVTSLATGIAGTSYSDTSGTPGVAYQYAVRAVNGCGNGTVSSCATGTRLACPNLIYDVGSFALTQISGDADAATMIPGEKWQLAFRMDNTGTAASAADARCTVTGSNGVSSGNFCTNPVTIGAVAAGGTSLVLTTNFIVPSGWVGTCGADVDLGFITKLHNGSVAAGPDEAAGTTEVGKPIGIFSGGTSTNTYNYNLAGGSTIACDTTTNFTLSVPDNVSITDVLSTVNMNPPTGGNAPTMTVSLIHPDATAVTIYSGATTGWSNPTASSFPTQFDGKPSNGNWTLRVVHSRGGGSPGSCSSGSLTSWSLAISYATGGWSCTAWGGSSSCSGATAPEVSDDAAHAMTLVKGAIAGRVTLSIEDVGTTNYNLYVSNNPSTLSATPFDVTSPDGKTSCATATSAGAGGMRTISEYDPAVTNDLGILYFLVSGDNGAGTEGSIGRTSGGVERVCSSWCAR